MIYTTFLLLEVITFIIYLRTFFITETIFSNSSSVIFVSDGKHTPFTNNCSATSPPTTSYSSKNGCKCIGFHTGLDSMFLASKESISSVDVTSPCNVIHDNQKFGASQSFSGINAAPSKPSSSRL